MKGLKWVVSGEWRPHISEEVDIVEVVASILFSMGVDVDGSIERGPRGSTLACIFWSLPNARFAHSYHIRPMIYCFTCVHGSKYRIYRPLTIMILSWCFDFIPNNR